MFCSDVVFFSRVKSFGKRKEHISFRHRIIIIVDRHKYAELENMFRRLLDVRVPRIQ